MTEGWKALVVAGLLCLATSLLSAQTFTTLASFGYFIGSNQGVMTLVQGVDGNLYGTTEAGGANGFGTVFQITPTGTLTSLYSFCSQPNCTDGGAPEAGLVLDNDGDFYGVTWDGGAAGLYLGFGTVFKITAGGTLTTLNSFAGTNGANPWGALVRAADGDFYGTTAYGGACKVPYGCGTVFKITAGGTLTMLHSFHKTDGFYPQAGLVQGADGNFYGTTSEGGANRNAGTVFKISAAGKLTTLHNFCAKPHCTDGAHPEAALVQGTDGDFYGTTGGGGNGIVYGVGTVFKITAGGTLTTLHRFNTTDGSRPEGGLIQATDGNFYGTTNSGGDNGAGTIFQITPTGALTTLHNFCAQTNCTDGADPQAGLVQGTDGNFYGTTPIGVCCGTVFSLSVGLEPFVETNPASGKVGAKVIILGNNLTNTTSITFNGITAPLLKVTASAIETSVPTGATTGTVIVTTPNGTLNSNVAFRVLP